jgi:hypothetical protein
MTDLHQTSHNLDAVLLLAATSRAPLMPARVFMPLYRIRQDAEQAVKFFLFARFFNRRRQNQKTTRSTFRLQEENLILHNGTADKVVLSNFHMTSFDIAAEPIHGRFLSPLHRPFVVGNGIAKPCTGAIRSSFHSSHAIRSSPGKLYVSDSDSRVLANRRHLRLSDTLFAVGLRRNVYSPLG